MKLFTIILFVLFSSCKDNKQIESTINKMEITKEKYRVDQNIRDSAWEYNFKAARNLQNNDSFFYYKGKSDGFASASTSLIHW